MISMKLSKEEAGKMSGAVETKPGDGPAYPYGLCLCLNNETLKKLGYTEPPAVGTDMLVMAKVTVTSTGVNQQQDGDKEARCELQVTDMQLAGSAPDAGKVYDKSKMNP